MQNLSPLPHRLIHGETIVINTRHISPLVAKVTLAPGKGIEASKRSHFSSLLSATMLSSFRNVWTILNDGGQELMREEPWLDSYSV